MAAVLVASLTVHMWRAGRYMKRDIEGKLEASSVKTGAAAFFGVFMFTLLMITREGMETALLMNALLFTVQSPQIIAGAVGGTILAALVASLWSRYGHRVNLARFFQVTAVFLLIFVVQLLIYGFHELTEANISRTASRGTTRRSPSVPTAFTASISPTCWCCSRSPGSDCRECCTAKRPGVRRAA